MPGDNDERENCSTKVSGTSSQSIGVSFLDLRVNNIFFIEGVIIFKIIPNLGRAYRCAPLREVLPAFKLDFPKFSGIRDMFGHTCWHSPVVGSMHKSLWTVIFIRDREFFVKESDVFGLRFYYRYVSFHKIYLELVRYIGLAIWNFEINNI